MKANINEKGQNVNAYIHVRANITLKETTYFQIVGAKCSRPIPQRSNILDSAYPYAPSQLTQNQIYVSEYNLGGNQIHQRFKKKKVITHTVCPMLYRCTVTLNSVRSC